jgi:signal transduction histidine kinase
MFKKLQRQILWLCMSITSIIILASFIGIYMVTVNNTDQKETQDLEGVMDNAHGNVRKTADGTYVEQIEQTTQYAPTFSLQLDLDGNILRVLTTSTIDNAVILEGARIAHENPAAATVTLGDDERLWRYKVEAQQTVEVSLTEQGNQKNSAEVTTGMPGGSGGSEVPGDGGEGSTLLAAFLDVTNTQKANQELRDILIITAFIVLALIFGASWFFSTRAIRPVEETWEKQKEFIANASHELKTPLTIILSNIGALTANSDETVASQMKWINRIEAGADRMNGLVQQLLLLARIDATGIDGKATDVLETGEQRVPVNLSEDVQAVVAENSARIEQKKLQLAAEIASDVWVLSIHEKNRQLIGILLDNAIKYTNDAGSIEVKLAKMNGKYAQLTVKNSGAGIAAEDLPRVFERFYRAKQQVQMNSAGSYGLGLSLAQALVEQLNGKITVSSTPGEFTLFKIILPLTTVTKTE